MTTRADVLIKGRELETRTKDPFKNFYNSTYQPLRTLFGALVISVRY